MSKVSKLTGVLFFLLMILFAFILGLVYAGIVDAGKDQGLAGGAIVLGYGVVGAVIGIVAAIIIVLKTNQKTLVVVNAVLAVLLVLTLVIARYKFKKDNPNEVPQQEIEQKTPKPTKAVSMLAASLTNEPPGKASSHEKSSMGLGMFVPDFANNSVMRFYGLPNFKASENEATPYDSITFKKTEHGGYDIATAPPWLVPDHLKLDYDLLYFRVKSVTRNFVEVVVNTTTGRTAFVPKSNGRMLEWPEFLLSVHSVEFQNPQGHKVYVKPLDHASTMNTQYSFMRPLRITQDWMQVEMMDQGYNATGQGWIRWHKDGKLLVAYSLLS